jgi:hypothetical protein
MVHRIAHELVRTGSYELARRVDWRGRAFTAGDEGRHAGEREGSPSSHQSDALAACPAGQREAQRGVIAVVQAQRDPAPQKNEPCAKDCGAKRDE